MDEAIRVLTSPGASATDGPDGGTRLQIPSGPRRVYRVAQLDDYRRLPRRSFLRRPPYHIELDARVSANELPGTWGWGVWNAPFSAAVFFGAANLLPALPSAAWFFFASPENHLSFRNDRPGNGFIAQSFRSARLPIWLLSPGALFLPLLVLRPAARLLRRLASHMLIRDDSAAITGLDATDWHHYEMTWDPDQVVFEIDGTVVFETGISPRGPLGLVIWIDNQFAAFTPEGRLAYGLLPNPTSAWLDIRFG